MKIERLIHRRAGAAIRNHRMLEEGDRVLIAVSGGVDSSVLARVLSEKRGNLPVKFELLGCHIETDLFGMVDGGNEWLDRFFSEIDVPLIRKSVPVLGRLKEGRSMNCFFCAMQRRKALLAVALENRCTKIAYGHHMDDVIETLLMNMLYNAKIATMPVRLELDDYDIVFVRPLCKVREAEVKRYAVRMEISSVAQDCPHAVDGRRAKVKDIVSQLARDDERIRDNLAASLGRVRTGYLTEKTRKSD